MCHIRGGTGMGVGSFEDNTRRVVGDGRNTYFWMDNWVGGVPLGIKFRRLFDLAVHRESSVAKMATLGWEEGGGHGCGGDAFYHGRRRECGGVLLYYITLFCRKILMKTGSGCLNLFKDIRCVGIISFLRHLKSS